ncbi:hypothetical protein [Nocardia amamiensis]|uniref:hypothetical protein n=1 Tax=Nocardia amamiensis TaxID=404578 RepID=UPI0033EFC6E8
MAGFGQAGLGRTGWLRAYWRSLVLAVAAVTAAGGSYWLFTFTNTDPSVRFYGSVGIYASTAETSTAVHAWYISGWDRVFLFVEAHHTGSGNTDFVLLLTGEAMLNDPQTNAHDGLTVTVQDVFDDRYQMFSFTLTESFRNGFVEINGLLGGKVADHRGDATAIELPTMGTQNYFISDWPPLNAIDPPLELSAFPGRMWFTPKDSKNVAVAGDVDINTTIDLARPPLDPNYPAQLVWSGSTLVRPRAHLTNYVQQRHQQGLLFGAGILAGLATSLLVEALVLGRVRRTAETADVAGTILSALRRRSR